MTKIEIGDVVCVVNKRKHQHRWYYGKVTGFCEGGLFVQPRSDMEPICFGWFNDIEVIKPLYGEGGLKEKPTGIDMGKPEGNQ